MALLSLLGMFPTTAQSLPCCQGSNCSWSLERPCVLSWAQPSCSCTPGSGDIPGWPQLKAGGCQSLWGQARRALSCSCHFCLGVRASSIPSMLPIREHQCQKEQWVTKRWLKCKERKDGIWDLAHVWVWGTPFFFTLQERSPCLHPQPTGMLPGLITWLKPN